MCHSPGQLRNRSHGSVRAGPNAGARLPQLEGYVTCFAHYRLELAERVIDGGCGLRAGRDVLQGKACLERASYPVPAGMGCW